MAESPDSEKIVIPVVTEDGPIYGYLLEADIGPVYHFSGIPYAKPPIGNLRFLVRRAPGMILSKWYFGCAAGEDIHSRGLLCL